MKTLEKADSISEKEREFLRRVKKTVLGLQPTAQVLLFGSVARGDQGNDSDYDVLILTDQPLATSEEDAIEDALYDLQLGCGALICAVFYSKDEWDSPSTHVLPLYKEIERDAVAL
ncbi:MAG TPA: nucleotidyltransferase domain-containing protein [Candidatus Hydrogenedentes bacterium]|nr:nucleotidyltransferase domain-containing protein [Candidatus Hydrogenedentota bacterium]HIJ74055.1 nucleotidyltransferase domain-containing protein [Candidatus Hydrogenedentota bacterium]